jgi:hypothetical protein
MKALNVAALVVAAILAAGELARYWGSERFVPMALDELAVAAALVWAVWRSRHDGARWHLAAWGGLCGLALVLLVQTADHQIHGPAKAAGPIYLAALGGLLVMAAWAIRRALVLTRAAASEPMRP